MKILLTGGAGFIGSHVAEQLISHGYEVIIIDNLISGSTTYLPQGVEFFQMDINDPSVEDVFKTVKPEIVLHLAAQTSVVHSMREPYFDFQSNTDGTVKLLQYAARYHVRQFIFSSTSAVYGEPTYLPIDEMHPIDPHSFYAVSKYAAERYIRIFAAQYGFTPTILRFSNVYGPRQKTAGEAGVVGIFILNYLKKEQCLIYGGNQTRDFIYVKDVAIACRKAIESDLSGIYNVSSSVELSIGVLNELISQQLEVNASANYMPFREGELIRSVLSNENAKKGLEWVPTFSLLEGLYETIQYIKEFQWKGVKVKN